MHREAEREALLLHEQVSLLFNAIPNSAVANTFGSLVAVFVYKDAIEAPRLYLWVAMLLTITLCRFRHYQMFRQADPSPAEIERWYLGFRIGSLLLAAAVGSAGFLLFVYEDSTYQLVLALMMVCIGSFAITTMSPRVEMAVIFLLIILAPLIGSLYLTHSGTGTYAIWMMLVMLAMLILSALRISRNMASSIQLRIEARHREQDLQDSQQRLQLYVQSTPLAMIEWNEDLLVKAWNPAASSIFGYTLDEAMSRKLTWLIFAGPASSRLQEIWLNLQANTGGQQLILENYRKDGSMLLCEWFNTPLINAEGATIGVMSLVQDVTQRMETEKLKQEFVSIVSHELRTPVTSIKGSLSLLVNGVLADDPARTDEMLRIALMNTNRLHLLINDILDVEKLESGRVEYRFGDHDLIALLREVMEANQAYADKYQVMMASEGFPASCMVYMDRDRIFQVLTNILSNAIKFSVTLGVVTVKVNYKGNKVRVGVHNRGEVIPDSDRTRLFTKFSQRDSSDTRAKEGSGLGLYICQRILEKHDSTLDFVSSHEHGTIFFFELDRKPG